MHASDRRAAIAVINKLAGILRTELGDNAQEGWPVLGTLLQNHLDGKQSPITALADMSGLPRTSARRVVFALKAEGWLEFHPLTGSGSRETITPSAKLLERVDRITEQTVRLILGANNTGSFDRFDASSLAPASDIAWPRAAVEGFDDRIELASRLQRPSLGRAGITWNAAPGLPLAESFLQILGAQGAMTFVEGVLHVDNDAGRRVIEYLRALVPLSPPDFRSVHWTRNAQIFGSGKAAMCYHWSNRYGMLDSHVLLQKGGRIGSQLHPTFAPGMTPVSPLGGALLAVPSSNGNDGVQRAWQAIETLTSPELMKYFVLHGAAGNARHSVAEDRYVLQRNRIVAVMDQLARTRQIQAFPSQPVSQYQTFTQILSDHLELLVFGDSYNVRSGLGKLQRALVRVGRGTDLHKPSGQRTKR